MSSRRETRQRGVFAPPPRRLRPLIASIFFFCTSLILMLSHTAWDAVAASSSEIGAEIAARREELEQKRKDHKELLHAISISRQAVNEATRQRIVPQTRHDEAQRKLSEIKKQLRDLDVAIARLRSPYELAEAFSNYKSAGQTKEAFIEFYTFVRGAPPDRATLSDYSLHALILEKEIRAKVAVPVGAALVKLGDLVLQIPEIALGMGALSPELHLNSKALESTGAEFLQWLTEAASRGRLAVEYEQAYVVIKALGLASTAYSQKARRFSDLNEVAISTRNKAGHIADGLMKTAKISFYGTEDRETAYRQAVEARENALSMLEGAETELADLSQTLKEIDAQIGQAKQAVEELQKAEQKLSGSISDIDQEIETLRVDMELAGYRERMQQFGGAPMFPVSIRLDLAGGDLAADSLTERALGLARYSRFSVTGGMGVVNRIRCEYNCRWVGDRYICSTATMQVWAFQPYTDYNFPGGIVQRERASVVVDQGRKRVIGSQAGEDAVFAATTLFQVGSRPHPCGREAVVTGVAGRSERVAFTVHKVTDVRYVTADAVETRTRDIDFFFAFAPALTSRDKVTITPKLVVSDGKKEYDTGLNGDSLASFIVGSGATVAAYPRSAQVMTARTPGKATLQMALKDADGASHFERKFTVTSNLVEREIRFPPNLPESNKDRVPIGEDVTYLLWVTGGADMSRYRVRWTTEGKGAVFAGTTEFTYSNDTWLAKNTARFSEELIKAWAEGGRKDRAPVFEKFGLQAEIVRKEDGKVVFTQPFPEVTPMMPRLEGFDIVHAGRGAIRVAQIDLFTPRTGMTYDAELALEARFATGRKYMLRLLNPQIIGPIAEALRYAWDQVWFTYSKTPFEESISIASRSVGTGFLIDSLGPDEAFDRGFVLGKEFIRDQILITLNKVFVQKIGEGRDAKFRASILGPARMEGYTAVWRMFGGSTVTTSFALKEGRYVTEVRGDQPLLSLEILSPSGNVVSKNQWLGTEQPLPPPWMSLVIPVESSPGKAVVLTVLIRNIRHVDIDDYVCEWQVDRTFGDVDRPESRVHFAPEVGEGGAACNATLKIAGERTLLGREAPVTVRLVRAVGRK